jgi:hypothetical protein
MTSYCTSGRDVATVLDRDVSALSDSKLHNENRELLSSVREFTEREYWESQENVSVPELAEERRRSACEDLACDWEDYVCDSAVNYEVRTNADRLRED